MADEPFKVLVATGIGDSIWGMLKVQAIAQRHAADRPIEILVGVWERSEIECRALPLLRRFPWVSSVRAYEMPKNGNMGPCLKSGAATDELGRYRYIDSGKPPFTLKGDVDFVAIPNGHLEYGRRLEKWLPEYDCNWDMFSHWLNPYSCYLANTEPHQQRINTHLTGLAGIKPNYLVFFMGGEGCNHARGVAGHNHGALWTGEQWASLGDRLIEEMNTEIVVVGAGYDKGYFENWVEPHIENRDKWHYRLAEFALMETMAICSQARAVVSYQSGIGIMSHYFRVPTVMWWRPEGDSIVKGHNVTFSEDMAHAWCYPDWKAEGKYLPCVYGRETVDDIARFVARF